MATFNTALKTFIQSDAEFRTMIGHIRTALTNFGWVQTADTGQINPATVTYPGSNNTDAGFEIWGMNDALQATRPVYMKLRYGRGGANGAFRLNPSFSMSATTGAGAFTGVEGATLAFSISQNPGTRPIGDTTAYNIYASGDTNRFVFAFFCDTLADGFGSMFSVERRLDVNGDSLGDGIYAYIGLMRQNVNNWFGQVYHWTPGYTPNWNTPNGNLAAVIHTNGSAFYGQTVRARNDDLSTLYQGKVFVFPHYAPVPGWKYPMRNWFVYALNDFPTDQSSVTIPFYGADRTYKPMGAGTTGIQQSVSPSLCLMIRYE